jgi:excisionase family DNA binding protein
MRTIAEVAATLNVHPSTLKRWITKGRVQARRMPSGHWRMTDDDIAALVADVCRPHKGPDQQDLAECLRWVSLKAGTVGRATLQKVAGAAIRGEDWASIAEESRGKA